MKVSLAEMLVAQVTREIADPVERAVTTRDVVVCDLGVDYPSETEKALRERREERAKSGKGART